MPLNPEQPAAAPPEPLDAKRSQGRRKWDAALTGPLGLKGSGRGAPEAWFLGPRAENVGLLHELVTAAIDSHAEFRRGFHPEDPTHLTAAMQASPEFRAGADRLRRETAVLLDKLKLSAPFSSMRYQGHMLWDQALPGLVGLVAALLYNQNNVAAEASPVTTRLEIEAGRDLCRMLGYTVPEPGQAASPGGLAPWGHITSGGTVANIEALWAARNLKFAAVALRAAIREVPALSAARGLEVPLWGGGAARLTELDTWTLLNLDLDVIAGLPTAMSDLGVSPEALSLALGGYAVQNVGLVGFYRSFMPDVPEAPVMLAPATGHYSWPKAATLLGLGQNALVVARVDQDARLDLSDVADKLERALRRRVPVLFAVAVIGSTEESAVDPLAGLLELRRTYQARGLNFMVHADAAWGGYFRAMLRGPEIAPEGDPTPSDVPVYAMSEFVQKQYEALGDSDSITVDPHKGGYIPYPAGALCYRNAAFRDAISLRAPVVFHSQTEPTVGIYGVEGSKPGSAAAAVWLAHRVIRPDRTGYGRILGQCMWTAKRAFCRLASLEDDRFTITPFNQTPAERAGAPMGVKQAELQVLRDLVPLTNAALMERLEQDATARRLFARVGSDQVILAFALNAKDANGRVNNDLHRANALNQGVFARCSIMEPRQDMSTLDLVLTSSRFDPSVYGQAFVDAFCRRMGVAPIPGEGVDFLITTTMDPWTTSTERGDFQAELEAALRRAVYSALDEAGFAETASSAAGNRSAAE
ncbi:MAG: pyridoxal phosphate-dependent decarboxylase family protein [Janthinobacterium lividum]